MSDSLNNVNINSLKNDIKNGKVVPFIGADISQSAKLKGYDEIDENTYILARNIWNLNSNLIITTNSDSVLEKGCDSKNVQPLYLDNNFKLSQAVSGELTKPTVWNIHGHESNLDSIILISESYKKPSYLKNFSYNKITFIYWFWI